MINYKPLRTQKKMTQNAFMTSNQPNLSYASLRLISLPSIHLVSHFHLIELSRSTFRGKFNVDENTGSHFEGRYIEDEQYGFLSHTRLHYYA